MNIAVCDDDAGTRRQMKSYLERYQEEQSMELARELMDFEENNIKELRKYL